MKPLDGMNRAGGRLRQFALGALLAWAGLPAVAQTIFHVGGEGAIADTVLTTVAEGPKQVATLVNDGVPWTAAGGAGIVYSRLISPTLTVANSGPVMLTFNHSYFFEDGWDGGAIYVSINGAAPTYVPPASFTANGYDGTLTGPGWVSTVFVGQETFTGKSAGYDLLEPTECIVNLGTLAAGDTVAVEFRGGWDESYVEPTTNWELFTVEVKDSAAATMLAVDFLEGPGGFTVVSDLDPAGSWRYRGQSSQFEINGDTLAADRYAPNIAGANTVIDLNGSELSVVLLAGTIEEGDTFALFDLSGGTTLRGDYHSISLPDGTWDVSQLKVNGTITCKAIGGGLVVKTYDSVQGPGYLDPIANLLALAPSGTGPQTANITYGDFLTLPGLTSAESFTVLWEGWLDVTVDGQGDYTFGTASDDGSVVYMDLNDDGDFSDAGELVVNNNRDQGVTVATGTVALNMDSVRVLIGFYENGGGEGMTARFKKGGNVAWSALQAVGGTSGHFSPVSLTPAKNITAFSVAPYGDAQILENRITFKVTDGGPVNALAPVITIDGSSVSPASGVPQDFSQPVTYTVTASNGSTREYVATALVIDLPVTAGLAAWLKADAIQPNDASQGRIFGGNAFVTRWNDQSGNRQSSTQPTAASQPRYLANDLNGLPTVKWDGTNQFLRGAVSTTVKTIFAVCKKDAEATTLDGLLCASPSQDTQNIRGNATNWAAPGGNPVTNGADFPNGGQVRVNGANSFTHNGQWHILMEESAASPVFTYQLGQTFLNRSLNGRIAEVIIYDRALTQQEADAVGSYLADKYALTTVYPAAAPAAKMYAFGIPGWPGVINEAAKTVALTVPFSADLTTLAPTFTLSGGATSDKASGSAQNFTAPVAYTVTSSDSAVSTVYTVTVTKAPVRTDKELLSFGPGGVINGTEVLWAAPYGSNLTSLSPVLVVSPLASVSPASGTTRDFTNPVTYTVTAEDGSTRVYNVTATVGPPPPTTRKPALWLDASQMLGMSQDQVVNLWPDSSGSLNSATLTQGSPLYKTDVVNGKPVVEFGPTGPSFGFNRISNIRSVFWVLKENVGASQDRFFLGDTSVYDFHRGAGSNGPIWSSQYTSGGILNGTTRLMGDPINGTTTSMPAGSFQLLSVVTTGDVRANAVTLDRNIANRSWNGEIAEILIYDQPLTPVEEAEIGSYLAAKYGLATSYPAAAPLANLYSFGLPGRAFAIDQTNKTISVTVPYGTDITSLAPTYVISGGATCDKASGSTQDFTNPVTYTVTSSDSAITNVFTVTVNVSPQPPSATVPVLWLDASKLTGLGDGQQVDTWFDSSGFGRHAIRVQGSPVYRTSVINGRPVVRFDTGSFTFPRIATIRSVFWVLKENAGASQPRFLLGDESAYHFHRSDGGPNGPPWSSAYSSPNILNGITKLMGVPVNGATTALPSGSFQVLSLVTTGNVQANTVSLDRNIANRSWNGDIAEILIYDQPLSGAEEVQIGSYLTAKYGLSTGYTTPYGSWAAGYPGFDLTNPAGDADNDGLTNEQEFAFGLNPTLGSSVSPITVPLNKGNGTFTYTRRDPALTGLGYRVWTSPDLENNWAWDQTANQEVIATNGDVQTVRVTLSTLPTGPALFVRVTAP
jgi:hypothetical protein